MITLSSFNPESMRLLFEYILERHSIQMKKDRGDPFPWTNNPYLRDNSFTCNQRIDDKTTKWLLQHISNNDTFLFSNPGDKFWRTIIFRIYNKIETAELIGLNQESFWSDIEESARKLDNLESDPYTRAYSTYSIKYRWKEDYPEHNWKSTTFLHLVDMANEYDKKIPIEIWKGNPEDYFNWFLKIPGIGNFLGMQLMIDTLYLPDLPFRVETNKFVVAGPGAQVGLEFIVNSSSQFKEDSYEDYLKYIHEHFEYLCREFYDENFEYSKIKSDLYNPYAYCLTDIQNIFCEYGKYRYMLENKYRRHRKYFPKTN